MSSCSTTLNKLYHCPLARVSTLIEGYNVVILNGEIINGMNIKTEWEVSSINLRMLGYWSLREGEPIGKAAKVTTQTGAKDIFNILHESARDLREPIVFQVIFR